MKAFLSRDRITAPPGFDRWLVPPCALAIHLCIGMAYGFSVFWLPLSHALGAPACTGLGEALISTGCNWRVSDLVWVYTLFFVVLGLSAALFGSWVERVGPRRAGLLSAACWCGGMAVGALGVFLHQLWLFWLGAGVLGGIGLGIGYITPVSTLIKWFPDRRGLATGMAIMGFGGGAMVGSPAADRLMAAFAGPGEAGVWQAMLMLAGVYALFMTAGALGFRLPAPGWAPPGKAEVIAGGRFVPIGVASRTPQFWLVWCVLLCNVSASIGIIGIASPMAQEIFGGGLFGEPSRFADFTETQKAAAAAAGAGFVGLISLFNIAGRFFWASLSDRIGRRAMYAAILALGAACYGLALPGTPTLPLFVAVFALIASMYGGGFAAVPAWLADLFGTRQVGAIHGRLLTAWSTAGILGPLLVAYVRDARLAAGVAREAVYGPIFLMLAGLLALGLVAALLVKPVRADLWQQDAESPPALASTTAAAVPAAWGLRLLAWATVLAPLAWGASFTVQKAAVLLAQ
ncbi:OFA family MFS transporter [Sandarakinorhabdus sp. AAP62]|uniref:OFA family MFS transporter n=1 Tax=Sandarakinorhabdus sp. AAP62 TaxID=1248916 RepID=UPI000379E676|nr:OFA family MFS transporter [Sandarakinorhabdus sp. AAP62]